MAGLVDEGRAGIVVYLEFSKIFKTISHKIQTKWSMNSEVGWQLAHVLEPKDYGHHYEVI